MNLHDFATFDAVHTCDTDDFFTTHNAYTLTAITTWHKSSTSQDSCCCLVIQPNVVLCTCSFLSFGELSSGKELYAVQGTAGNYTPCGELYAGNCRELCAGRELYAVQGTIRRKLYAAPELYAGTTRRAAWITPHEICHKCRGVSRDQQSEDILFLLSLVFSFPRPSCLEADCESAVRSGQNASLCISQLSFRVILTRQSLEKTVAAHVPVWANGR